MPNVPPDQSSLSLPESLPANAPAVSVAHGPRATDGSAPESGVADRGVADRGVTPRVVALCLALAVVCGYIIPVIDHKLANTFLGAQHLPPGAVAVLAIFLLVVNPLLRLISRRLVFSRNEMLTVYISCLFSMLAPGHGGETFFISNVIAPFYFATRENHWLDFLREHLPSWMTPAFTADRQYNRAVVEPWFTGLRAGETIPWDAWLVPLFAWGAFIVASYVMLGCLSVILRAQWSEREALAFPLLRLPLEMTEGNVGGAGDGSRSPLPPFFRNPLMWVGWGIGVFIQLMRGLNFYYPDVPSFPLDINAGPLFTEAPWNQIGWTPILVFPIAVGISYLLTSEVSFSFWFFYWFIKLQLIAAYYAGFTPNSLPSIIGGEKMFIGYQHIGSYFAYAAIVLWTAREHLRHVARRAFRREPPGEGERHEALSYPVAFWGFVLSFSFMVAWCVAAGIRADTAIVLWTIYVITAIALTRVLVEGGLLFLGQGWTPLAPLAQLVGSGPGTWLPPQSLVPAAFAQGAMLQDMRSFLMPSFVQGFKLAHDRKISARPLLALIFAVIFITFSMSVWMHVRLGYENSGLSLEPWYAQNGARIPADNIVQLINGARDVRWTNWAWLGSGMTLTYLLMLARSRLSWFPLHPLGFVMCLTYPMHRLWFSILLGWMCKVTITRFGGIDTYRKLTPVFLGLALGDVTMMLFWLCIDGWQGRSFHQLAV